MRRPRGIRLRQMVRPGRAHSSPLPLRERVPERNGSERGRVRGVGGFWYKNPDRTRPVSSLRNQRVTLPHSPPSGGLLYRLGPAVVGATAFACADMLGKVAFNSGGDVLTVMSLRSPIGLALLYAWLRFGAPAKPLTPRARLISLGLGVLFTGNVYWLYTAIDVVGVPVAVLTYFTYPLLTGLAAAATG